MSNRLTFIGASRGTARRRSRIVARLASTRVSAHYTPRRTARLSAPAERSARQAKSRGAPCLSAPRAPAHCASQHTTRLSTPRLNAPHVSTYCTSQRTAHLNALRASRHRVSQCTPQCAARLSAPAGCSIQQAKPVRHPMSQRTACLNAPHVSRHRVSQCAAHLSAPHASARRVFRGAMHPDASSEMPHNANNQPRCHTVPECIALECITLECIAPARRNASPRYEICRHGTESPKPPNRAPAGYRTVPCGTEPLLPALSCFGGWLTGVLGHG